MITDVYVCKYLLIKDEVVLKKLKLHTKQDTLKS